MKESPFIYNHLELFMGDEQVRRYVCDTWLPQNSLSLDQLLKPSQEGKMFGVLVGKWCSDKPLPDDASWYNQEQQMVLLRAYSGQMNNVWSRPTWVPSLLDHCAVAAESWRTQKALHHYTKQIKELTLIKGESKSDGQDITSRLFTLKKARRYLSQQHAQTLRKYTLLYSHEGKRISLANYWKTAGTGVGECCAPKLISRARLLRIDILGIAEFWWGPLPKKIQSDFIESRDVNIEQEGLSKQVTVSFYGPCKARCQPLLPLLLGP